jgi:hypothetical protein
VVFAPPCTDEELQIAVQAVAVHGSQVAAAIALDLPRGTLQGRLRTAAKKGMMLSHSPAMPGFRISQVTTDPNGGKFIQQKPEHGSAFEVPAGHVIKGVSALLNADGEKIIEWVKTKEGERDPLAIADALKTAFVDYEPAAPAAPMPDPPANGDVLTLLPCQGRESTAFSRMMPLCRTACILDRNT